MSQGGIDILLDLDGTVLDQGDGYWIKIDAWRVAESLGIPHGVRYALTLHAPNGERLLGFDNAHAVKARGNRFAGQRLPFDHRHRHVNDIGVPYVFKDAHQLLSDFFSESDLVLQAVKP